jgi:hypothetical protein
MDLAAIRNEVTRVIGLDSTAAGADETLVDQWANEAVIDILLQTRCYVTSATAETTADTGDYTFDSGILHVVDMYIASGGNSYRLKQVSPAELLDMRVNGQSVASAPVSHFAVVGSNMLALFPTPSDTETFTLYYVPRPTAMTTGTHDPSDTTYGGIPSEFHRAIVKYVEAEAADYRDDKSSQQGDRYRNDYLVWLGKIHKYTNQKGSTDTTAFDIPGGAWPPHDPSTDIRC